MRVIVTLLIDKGGKVRLRSDRLLPPSEEKLAFDALAREGRPAGVEKAWLLDTDAGGSFRRLEPAGKSYEERRQEVIKRTEAAAEKRRKEQAAAAKAARAKNPAPAKNPAGKAGSSKAEGGQGNRRSSKEKK